MAAQTQGRHPAATMLPAAALLALALAAARPAAAELSFDELLPAASAALPTDSHEVCPTNPGLLGRCTVASFALPTNLCNIGSDGALNLTDCLLSCGPGWNCAWAARGAGSRAPTRRRRAA